MHYNKHVQTARKIENLALIGFMGVGKSSVGQISAKQLRFDFLDTDRWIEAQAGMTIPEIFALQGEPAFRQYERQLVEQLQSRTRTVISTGGGLATNAENIASLKVHALVVYLWASPKELFERASQIKGRPLLEVPDPMARIQELLSIRDPFYRQADVLVNTERRTMLEISSHIIHQFQLARRDYE